MLPVVPESLEEGKYKPFTVRKIQKKSAKIFIARSIGPQFVINIEPFHHPISTPATNVTSVIMYDANALSTYFGTLPSGDTNKIIRGSEFDTEFDALVTAVATKADTASPTFTGTVTVPALTITGNVTVDLGSADTVTIDGGTY